MMPEENVIPLIVEGNNSASFEIGIVMENRGQHSRYSVTKFGREIIQDNFRPVVSELFPLPPHFSRRFLAGQLEMGSRTVG
jgi:hypothetical protein